MRQRLAVLLGCFLGVMCLGQPARAELINLGNEMIYDTVQDLTWLQDLNFMQDSGFDADGRLTYAQAQGWASQLTFGGLRRLETPGESKQSCRILERRRGHERDGAARWLLELHRKRATVFLPLTALHCR